MNCTLKSVHCTMLYFLPCTLYTVVTPNVRLPARDGEILMPNLSRSQRLQNCSKLPKTAKVTHLVLPLLHFAKTFEPIMLFYIVSELGGIHSIRGSICWIQDAHTTWRYIKNFSFLTITVFQSGSRKIIRSTK